MQSALNIFAQPFSFASSISFKLAVTEANLGAQPALLPTELVYAMTGEVSIYEIVMPVAALRKHKGVNEHKILNSPQHQIAARNSSILHFSVPIHISKLNQKTI